MWPYMLSLGLVVAGLLVLALVAAPTVRSVRRFSATVTETNGQVTDESGLLRARSAALGVAIRQRRRVRIEEEPARVPSGQPAQTGGRP